MKKLFAGAAVLVAVLCAWLWRATRSSVEEPVAPALLAAKEPSEPETPVLLAGPEPAAGDARAAPAANVPSGSSAYAEGVEPARLEVRVLLGPDGAPARGAEVFLLADERIDTSLVREIGSLGRMGIDQELETLAQRVVAGAEGRAELPTPLGPSKLAARLGDGYAVRPVDGGEPGPIVLELAPDPPVRVRVVGEDGLPVAGVPVALCPAKLEWGGDHDDCPRELSGTDGLVELRARGLRGPLRASGARVALAILLREPVDADVDIEQPPREPVELRLPPTGSLAVTIVDGRGEPWMDPAAVAAGLSARTRAEVGDAAKRIHQPRGATGDGRVLFEHVGLGLELSVWASTETLGDPSEVATGPRTPGERVAVVLDAGEPLRTITGRVVDPQGRPIGPAKLSVLAHVEESDFPFPCGWVGVTDGEGRFRTRVHTDGPIERLQLETIFPADMEYSGEPFAAFLGPGETDLGDIVLARRPLLVSGTIRDEKDQPIRRARVSLHVQAADPLDEWGSNHSDALGRFEVRGDLGVTSVELVASATGFVSSEVRSVPVGSSGVEIVLERAGSIVGRLAPGSPSPKLSLSVAGQSADVPQSHGREGQFRFPSVRPGTWTLTATYPWSAGQLEIPGLVVVAGEETRDARLEPLDLGAILPRITLTVVDDHGAAVPGIRARLRQSGSDKFQDCRARREDDRLVITAGPLPLHLRLEAEGFRSLELTGVDSDRTVTLERGIPVRLVLDGGLPDLPAGWELGGALDSAARSKEFIYYHGENTLVASFEWTRGSALVHLSKAGSYAFVHRLVQRHAGRVLQELEFWSEENPALDVAEGNEPQVFEVALSPETLSEILAYIEEQE